MPCDAPAMPRKMLPPPMTRQHSTPRAWTCFTSSATRLTVAGSSPNSRCPIRASPEIFSKHPLVEQSFVAAFFRHHPPISHPFQPDFAVIAARLSRVRLLLLDAFAQGEAGEASDLDRRADVLGRLSRSTCFTRLLSSMT